MKVKKLVVNVIIKMEYWMVKFVIERDWKCVDIKNLSGKEVKEIYNCI